MKKKQEKETLKIGLHPYKEGGRLPGCREAGLCTSGRGTEG
jgi:hypothetical protein